MPPSFVHGSAGVAPPPDGPPQRVWLRSRTGGDGGPSPADAPWLRARHRDERSTDGASAVPEFDDLAFDPLRVRAGRKAFLQGQPFKDLLGVRSGSFKMARVHRDGREQVTQFCFAGDLMGLDGLAGAVHASTATALEDSTVCAVPLTSLRDAVTRSRPWPEVLCRQMSHAIVREHDRMLLLGSTGAACRVATFLLEVSDRLGAGGFSPLDFRMRMTRVDIGSYLGVSMETVSRMLSTLQQQGLLTVGGRHIVIRSLAGLRDVRDRNSA